MSCPCITSDGTLYASHLPLAGRLKGDRLSDIELRKLQLALGPAWWRQASADWRIEPQVQVQRKLTVVDDVPHAGDPVQRRRLTELLVQLARSSRFPVALIVTGSHAPSGDAGRSGGSSRGASFQGWHRVSRLSS